MTHEELNQQAVERAQALLAKAPETPEEIYLCMITHLIAFISLAKHHNLPEALMHSLLESMRERVVVFDRSRMASG